MMSSGQGIFKKGRSGNPAGRPKGIADKRVALRAMLEPHAEALVTKLVDLATNGDVAALRICIDRLIPPMKARDMPVQLGTMPETLADQGRTVLSAVGDGRLTPEQGSTLMQAISSQARIVEVDELERRVAALEGKQADPVA